MKPWNIIFAFIISLSFGACSSNKSKESYEALVELTISSEGKPVDVKILTPDLSPDQQKKVISNAMKFVFHPAMKDGVLVEAKKTMNLTMKNM